MRIVSCLGLFVAASVAPWYADACDELGQEVRKVFGETIGVYAADGVLLREVPRSKLALGSRVTACNDGRGMFELALANSPGERWWIRQSSVSLTTPAKPPCVVATTRDADTTHAAALGAGCKAAPARRPQQQSTSGQK